MRLRIILAFLIALIYYTQDFRVYEGTRDQTRLVAYHYKKKNGKRFFVSLYWKIPETNETSEKVVLFSFSGRNISKGDSCYI